jgi:hypothetical protein
VTVRKLRPADSESSGSVRGLAEQGAEALSHPAAEHRWPVALRSGRRRLLASASRRRAEPHGLGVMASVFKRTARLQVN